MKKHSNTQTKTFLSTYFSFDLRCTLPICRCINFLQVICKHTALHYIQDKTQTLFIHLHSCGKQKNKFVYSFIFTLCILHFDIGTYLLKAKLMYFAIQKLPEIDCDCFNLMVGLLDFSSCLTLNAWKTLLKSFSFGEKCTIHRNFMQIERWKNAVESKIIITYIVV